MCLYQTANSAGLPEEAGAGAEVMWRTCIRRAIALLALLWTVPFGLYPSMATPGEGATDGPAMLVPVRVRPEVQKAAEQREYSQGWSHHSIYVDKNLIPMPARERQLLRLPPGAAFTSLTGSTSGSCVVVGVTSARGSSLSEVRGSPQIGESRVLLDASALGEDLWCGQPASQSPNGRWLLVTVRPGRGKLFGAGPPEAKTAVAARRAPGTLYLLDCTQEHAPLVVEPECLLAAAAWSLSGDKVACTLRLDDGWTVALVTPPSAEQRVVLRRPAQAAWSLDGNRLHLFSGEWDGVTEVVCDLESGELESAGSRGVRARMSMDAVWSEDRSIAAWIDADGDCACIGIGTAEEMVRLAPAPTGIDRLLGWSWGGQLLAYRDPDGGVQITSGTRSKEIFECITAVYDSFPRSKRRADGEGALTLGTTFTPVRIGDEDLSGWARTAEGPCLVYTASGSQEPAHLSAVYFREETLLGLDIDLTKDLAEEHIKTLCESHLNTVEMTIRLYAADHDGRYPPHASGPDLEKDLEEYGPSRCFMGSAFAPDEYRVRLLYPGGTREEVLRKAAELGETHIPLLELRETDGRVFHIYTDGWVWMTLPNGVVERINTLDRE